MKHYIFTWTCLSLLIFTGIVTSAKAAKRIRQIFVILSILLFANSAFAAEYSAMCNCMGIKRGFFGGVVHTKGVVAGGSGYSIGSAIKSAARECFIGLLENSCRVFLDGKLIYSEVDPDEVKE